MDLERFFRGEFRPSEAIISLLCTVGPFLEKECGIPQLDYANPDNITYSHSNGIKLYYGKIKHTIGFNATRLIHKVKTPKNTYKLVVESEESIVRALISDFGVAIYYFRDGLSIPLVEGLKTEHNVIYEEPI